MTRCVANKNEKKKSFNDDRAATTHICAIENHNYDHFSSIKSVTSAHATSITMQIAVPRYISPQKKEEKKLSSNFTHYSELSLW